MTVVHNWFIENNCEHCGCWQDCSLNAKLFQWQIRAQLSLVRMVAHVLRMLMVPTAAAVPLAGLAQIAIKVGFVHAHMLKLIKWGVSHFWHCFATAVFIHVLAMRSFAIRVLDVWSIFLVGEWYIIVSIVFLQWLWSVATRIPLTVQWMVRLTTMQLVWPWQAAVTTVSKRWR